MISLYFIFGINILGEEILVGRKFGGNKILWNWREFNLADGGKHIFWRELKLAGKQKIEYHKCCFYQKMIYFLLTTRIKQKEKHNNDVYDTKFIPNVHSRTAAILLFYIIYLLFGHHQLLR